MRGMNCHDMWMWNEVKAKSSVQQKHVMIRELQDSIARTGETL